jgi:hypothetical protein
MEVVAVEAVLAVCLVRAGRVAILAMEELVEAVTPASYIQVVVAVEVAVADLVVMVVMAV